MARLAFADPTPSISRGWRKAEGAAGGGAASSWPEEAPGRGVGVADGVARTATSTAARERIYPPIAGSDLRDARVTAASAAAESGKGLEAAVEGGGGRLGAGGDVSSSSSASSTAAATSAASGVPPANSTTDRDTGDGSRSPGRAQSAGGADGGAASDGQGGARERISQPA
jgi:hypothetical protein